MLVARVPRTWRHGMSEGLAISDKEAKGTFMNYFLRIHMSIPERCHTAYSIQLSRVYYYTRDRIIMCLYKAYPFRSISIL